MASAPLQPHEEQEEIKLFSEQFETFIDALECLYLYNNISGRHQFRQDWPDAANYIYPKDLIKVDDIGTKDKEFRATLELQADTLRIELLNDIEELQNLVEKDGTLSTLHVKGMIQKLGRNLTLYIIHEDIINQINPKTETPEKTDKHQTKSLYNIEIGEGPNLAIQRRLFEAEPASARVLTYEKLLRKVMRNPHKHRLRNAFNKSCKAI